MNAKRILHLCLQTFCIIGLIAVAISCNRKAEQTSPSANRQLTIAIDETPITADPVLGLDVGSFHLINSLHAPLCVVGPDGKLVMVLAESVKMAADGLSCEITLKPAKFWDQKGSPVTSEDVRYSFERVRASANPNRWILDRVAGVEAFDKKVTEHIAGIEIVGERQLTIRLARPDPDFSLLISSGLTSIIMGGSDKLPKQPFDQQVVGAGPWKPVRFIPGVSFELSANSGFPQRGNAERLTFAVESNPQNQLEGVRKGKFDVIRLRGPMLGEACEPMEGGGLQPKPAFKNTRLLQTHANELTFLKWNWSNSQLANIPEVQRKTLLAAVSSQVHHAALAKTLYLGAGEMAYGIAPPSTLPSAPEPSMSAADLKGIGARTLTLLAANDPSSRQLAGSLQTQLSELGLKVDLTFVDLGGLVQRLIKGDYCVCLLWYEQLIPSTGCFAWSLFWTPNAPLTFLGETIQGLGDPANTARGILNLDLRRAAYEKMAEEIAQTQTAWTPLLSRNAVMMVNPRCEGLFLDVNGFPYFLFLRVKE
jgi:ABC-type transport system substrate-binding protein